MTGKEQLLEGIICKVSYIQSYVQYNLDLISNLDGKVLRRHLGSELYNHCSHNLYQQTPLPGTLAQKIFDVLIQSFIQKGWCPLIKLHKKSLVPADHLKVSYKKAFSHLSRLGSTLTQQNWTQHLLQLPLPRCTIWITRKSEVQGDLQVSSLTSVLPRSSTGAFMHFRRLLFI